jgi:hypothetical protein
MVTLIDQLAAASTAAAVSSASAAWWTLVATIFAAISNVAVLVYIFSNQNRQEREARRRRVRIARMNLVNGIDALERAEDLLMRQGAAERVHKGDVAALVGSARTSFEMVLVSDVFHSELRETARGADDIARVMSMRLDQTDRPWVVASEVIGGLAHELRELATISAKLSHEASLVERIEKLAYGHLDDETRIRPTTSPPRKTRPPGPMAARDTRG